MRDRGDVYVLMYTHEDLSVYTRTPPLTYIIKREKREEKNETACKAAEKLLVRRSLLVRK